MSTLKPKPWTEAEYLQLKAIIQASIETGRRGSWDAIAAELGTVRTAIACKQWWSYHRIRNGGSEKLDRDEALMNPALGRWSKAEEKGLVECLDRARAGRKKVSWDAIAEELGSRRTGRSCRAHWYDIHKLDKYKEIVLFPSIADAAGSEQPEPEQTWNLDQLEQLVGAVEQFPEWSSHVNVVDWDIVAGQVAGDKTGESCQRRWEELLNDAKYVVSTTARDAGSESDSID